MSGGSMKVALNQLTKRRGIGSQRSMDKKIGMPAVVMMRTKLQRSISDRSEQATSAGHLRISRVLGLVGFKPSISIEIGQPVVIPKSER
jgi:hypothetical protein